MKSVWEEQHGGNHYKKYAIQPTEYSIKNGLNFCEGNVVKYITRWRDKGGLVDLLKAKHYVEMLIETEGKEHERRAATNNSVAHSPQDLGRDVVSERSASAAIREAEGQQQIPLEWATEADHIHTPQCGFDRDASINLNTYVCLCGYIGEGGK